MHRATTLFLAMAAQLQASASIAMERPVKNLQLTAGQFKAAVWTDTTKMEFALALQTDSKTIIPISSDEQGSFQRIVERAETLGARSERQRGNFQHVATILGLSPLAAEDTVTINDARVDDQRMYSVLVRRRPSPAMVEVIFAHGVRGEDGVLRAHFYVTSSDGVLKKVVYIVTGSESVTLAPRRAAAAYAEALKFWTKWEQDHRQ